MKVVAIVGSIRKDSFNLKLAKHIQTRYAENFELEILDLKPIPMYNQDTELDAPQEVLDFKAKVKAADAVLWITPEYNSTIPGVLGNAIDWMSRVDKVMNKKPSMIMGASMGAMGTVKAQMHLRDILFASGLNSPLLPMNEVYVGAAHTKFNDNGELIDQATIEFIDTVVANFQEWIKNFS